MVGELISRQHETERRIERAPQPRFHGMLVTPESLKFAPDGQEVTAAFNAALVAVPNKKKPGVLDLASVYRVMTGSHIADEPDRTTFFGIQKLYVTSDGMTTESPHFIQADSLIAQKDTGKNPEDMRLRYDEKSGKVVGGLTEAFSRFNPENGNHDVVPLIASIEATPKFDGKGNVTTLSFVPAALTTHLVEGKEQPFYGKNVQAEFDAEGQMLLRYRPEFVDNKDRGEENRTHFQTLKQGADGQWEPLGEDGIYDTDLSQILPPGHTLKKFGLNGKAIELADGRSFRVDHVCSTGLDGKIEYRFVTVDGAIKPLLTFDGAVALTGQQGEDLTGEKRVIYCNGMEVIPVMEANGEVRNRLIMAVTLFDRSVAILSYDVEELADYATRDEAGPSISMRQERHALVAA